MHRFGTPLLLTAFLLQTLAASAQTPMPFTQGTAPSVSAAQPTVGSADLKWRCIILHNAAPLDALKLMHWDKDVADMDPFRPVQTPQATQPIHPPTDAKLPEGVVHIFALQSNNSLLLQATDAGFEQVKEIVKTLDVAPRQVQIKTLFAAVPLDANLTIDLSDANQALLQIHKAPALFYQPPQIVTKNNVSAGIALTWSVQYQPLFRRSYSNTTQANQLVGIPTLQITPRINSDHTVTFNLDFCNLLSSLNPTVLNQMPTTLHTVPSDSMAVYDVTRDLQPKRYRVFLFVTPTILSANTAENTLSATP